jgi:hypothetical protein
MRFSIALVLVLQVPVYADSVSRGPMGANATGLTLPNGSPLNGLNITVGQVEVLRPAKTPPDDPAIANPWVNPFQVTTQAGTMAVQHQHVDDHPTGVASVIISTDTVDNSPMPNGIAPTGIAQGAKLYASGFVTLGIEPGYADALRTTQYIAKLFPFENNLQHVRAINHSWLKEDTEIGSLDGNSYLTLGMDWIAMEFDVLNVFGGPEGGSETVIPSDNYNGITVAYSAKSAGDQHQFPVPRVMKVGVR